MKIKFSLPILLLAIGSLTPANAQTRSAPTVLPSPTPPTCNQFRAQSDAQAFLEQNPQTLTLDPDQNGIACESLLPSCDRFQFQAQAQAYLAEHQIAGIKLDPDQNGIACDALLPECERFQSQQEAQAYLERSPIARLKLDPDNNGAACEMLSRSVRSDGRRITSNSGSDGWFAEIWQSSRADRRTNRPSTVYYIRAWKRNSPDFIVTTGNFASQQEALAYFEDYLR
ncbi:MAG TPA: hypothetical protein V6D10_07475 [Trichocoleus sp.]|jgi:hypothetical protein